MNDATTIAIGDAIRVNRMGFGAMRLCGAGIWGWPADRENALRVLRRAIELGVNFIDTADAYGPNVNEEQIAQALYPYPSDLVIATKGGSTRGGPGDWGRDGRPSHLKEACEGSLRRLRLEWIDLYQLHAVDPHGTVRGSGRCAARAARRREDSVRRALQRDAGPAAGGARHRRDRFGAEQL